MRVFFTFSLLAFQICLSAASFKGIVWNDLNANGLREESEPVLPNIWVDLKDRWGNTLSGMYTSETGEYLFEDLSDGYYQIRVSSPLFFFEPSKQSTKISAGAGGGDVKNNVDKTGFSPLLLARDQEDFKVDAGLTTHKKCTEPIRVNVDTVWCLPDAQGVMVRFTAYGGTAYNGLSYGWRSEDAGIDYQTYGQTSEARLPTTDEPMVSFSVKDIKNEFCKFDVKIEKPECPETKDSTLLEDPNGATNRSNSTANKDCPKRINIFPNPVDQVATIDLSDFPDGVANISVFDALGRLLESYSAAGGSVSNLRLGSVASDFVVVQVHGEGCYLSQRLGVRQH